MAGLDPQFVIKLNAFERRLSEAGIRVRRTCGYRSITEQNRLYAKGRTTAGPKVTNARGGYSWHNFGLAADYVFIVGGKISWEGDWKLFGKIARQCGLEWGGDFKSFVDRPHVQWRRGRTLAQMRKASSPSHG